MQKFFKENIVMVIFIVTSLINGWLLRCTSTGNALAIRPLLGDLSFLILISAFGYFFKKKRNLYFGIMSFALVFFCCLNSVYFNEYHEYVSFYLIETLFEVFKMPSEAICNVTEITDYIYLWQLLVMFFVLKKHRQEYTNNLFKKHILTYLTLIVVLILSMNSEDIYRLKNNWNKEYVARNFGIYNYQVKDLFTTLKQITFKKSGVKEATAVVEEYYNDKKDTSSNEYTNIFKDKNIIFIHGESIQTMFMDDTFDNQPLMPNLAKMASEGLFFSNFYSEESVGNSSDTEFTLNNSILPIGVGTTFINYNDRHYQSLPSILNKQGYYTFSMHGNVCNFWKRDEMYDSMGYNHFYCYDQYDLSEKVGLGLSDKSFFKQSVFKIKEVTKEHPKFMATLIMLSNHTPFYTNELVDDYPVGDLKNSKIGAYLQLVHYADEAIGLLLDELDKEGLLENTVVVFYGDHDSKLKDEEYQKYFHTKDKIDFYEYESYTKVPLIIWTKDQKVKGEITKVMGMIDVLPTLGNMFGFKSDYALGHDIFATDDNMVVFPNGNWITDKMYQNNQMGTSKKWGNVSDEYINNKEKEARKIVEVSNYLIKYDLFK